MNPRVKKVKHGSYHIEKNTTNDRPAFILCLVELNSSTENGFHGEISQEYWGNKRLPCRITEGWDAAFLNLANWRVQWDCTPRDTMRVA